MWLPRLRLVSWLSWLRRERWLDMRLLKLGARGRRRCELLPPVLALVVALHVVSLLRSLKVSRLAGRYSSPILLER